MQHDKVERMVRVDEAISGHTPKHCIVYHCMTIIIMIDSHPAENEMF